MPKSHKNKKSKKSPSIRGPRSSRKNVRLKQRVDCEKRESLEKKWFSKIEFATEFSDLVTSSSGVKEPYHRWFPYRQGFSPELIRKFVSTAEVSTGPILDPFCGSGTSIIECAKLQVNAVGVEALASLAFITKNCLNSFKSPDLSTDIKNDSFENLYALAENDLAKTSILLSLTKTISGDGRTKKTQFNTEDLMRDCISAVNEDKRINISGYSHIIQGDARKLPFCNNTFGGIVTSPPYLSKYDYTKVNSAVENMYKSTLNDRKSIQLKANHKAHKSKWSNYIHPAVAETIDRLNDAGKPKLSGIVRSYFDELNSVFAESARVLQDSAPLTIVIAGSLFNGVYIPTDLISAELCEQNNLIVEEILSVRNFGAGKSLGTLKNISPREVIMSARKLPSPLT
ncbi:MAG: DNA methyltransferase [Planctomycetota bacterium]|jgi:hypothetical protein